MSDAERTGANTAAEAESDLLEPAKIIKRYANRKLYDTVESRYVTLEEIAEMVKGGTDVRIVDNRSKEDLTSITLAQIIFEGEKRQSQMPLTLLKRIIQGGNVVTDLVTKVSTLREEAETRVNRLFKREGEVTPGGPPVPAPAPAAKPAAQVREVFTSSQRAFDEWQRRIDDGVRSAVESVTGLAHLQKDFQRLSERLDRIEQRLAAASSDGANGGSRDGAPKDVSPKDASSN